MIGTRISELKAKLRGGVAPALATPVLADGMTVNTAVLPNLINFLLDAGVSGLFVGGTTGEGVLLSELERMRLHETAVSVVNGRVPVICHTGTNQLASTLALCHHAETVGADAVAVVTPFFYKMDDNGLADFYHAVAAANPNLALMLYDIPQLAVNGISPALMARLGSEIPSLLGIKSSRPDAQIVRQLIDAAAPHLLFLVGNEAAALGMLALGADGLISGLSTAVPEPYVALTKAFFRGDMAEAQRQQRQINALLAQLPGGARIGAIKQILTGRGVAMGTAVPPRPMPTEDIWLKIRPLLDNAK
ncbi:MAG: dihydrodipicolinate synthase family protein [Anaerolineales bacterium]|nr:dihydrodipicolinate synthase family protein [Anaerolineales bacterium]MCB8939976.1 dihydrodipicolinate synthase family protein [Ardenticatenaceae bacterium]